MRLERLKPGELQQISNIGRGKPVLLRARHLHAQPLGERNEWFPQMIVGCYQHACASLAKRSQITQGLEHIHRVADVVKEDVIEFFVRAESAPELFLVWKRDRKFEGWVSLPRNFHNLGADIDTFSPDRLHDGQKIPDTAANRKNASVGLDQKTKQPAQQFVVVLVTTDPGFATSSNPDQMITGAFASLLKRRRAPRLNPYVRLGCKRSLAGDCV